MENIYVIWNSFFKTLPQIKKSISANAVRSGVSDDAALLLVAIYEFSELKISADENLKNELFIKGLVEYTENGILVTSKGAILAKSFCNAIQRYK